MEQIQFEQIVKGALATNTLQDADIPSIDLYMDQVVTLLNGNIGLQGQEEQLTKTMINNYRKENLILPMKGKRYCKDQIYQILFVYYLKQGMSMADIKTVLNSLGENSLQPLYTRFLKEQQETKKTVEAAVCSREIKNTEDLAALLLQLSATVSFLEHISKELTDKLLGGK